MNIVRAFPESRPVTACATGSPLPSGLIVPPGYYVWQGQPYDCRKEQAYRFWTPGVDRAIRIVWAGDVIALMRSLSWITAIGVADEAAAIGTITSNARWAKPRLLCGSTVAWAKAICDSLGVPARVVRSLTADAPSGYFDGHVMLEAKVSGAWKLFDLAGGYMFLGGDGSARDALPLAGGGGKTVLSPKTVSPDFNASSAFEAGSWYDCTLTADGALDSEWCRVLQIPGIDRADGTTAFCHPAGVPDRTAWILSLSPTYRVISRAAWLSEFYA